MGYAQQWEQYANINFEFGSDPVAEIRSSFESDPGRSWSRLGIDALRIPSGEPTMNYGWLTLQLAEERFARVILHEFGHALAAIHEHQHPEGDISWNKEAVYRFYAQNDPPWSKEQVDHNLFEVYDKTSTNSGAYDRFSIMHYPIPAQLVTNPNDAAGWNSELSPADKQFIGTMYPF
jgi:hypothetical protein